MDHCGEVNTARASARARLRLVRIHCISSHWKGFARGKRGVGARDAHEVDWCGAGRFSIFSVSIDPLPFTIGKLRRIKRKHANGFYRIRGFRRALVRCIREKEEAWRWAQVMPNLARNSLAVQPYFCRIAPTSADTLLNPLLRQISVRESFDIERS